MLPPVKVPTAAAYHPRLPGLVSAELKTYLHWAKATPDKPIIAVLNHQQYIASMQTGFIDDMIARIEAQGATPVSYTHLDVYKRQGLMQWHWGQHALTAGTELRRETLINAGLTYGRDSANHKAVFLQDEITLSQTLSATLGLRRDQHALFGSKTSPRAYLVWAPNEACVIKGGFGTAFKAPTLKQISPNYVGAEGPHTVSYTHLDVYKRQRKEGFK